MSDQSGPQSEEGAEKSPQQWTYTPQDKAPEASFVPPPLPISPASFPGGFWARLDYLMQHPGELRESIRRDMNLIPICKILLISSLAMAATYGAVMGATNLLQGAPMSLWPKLAFIGITAVKVPILFILTLFIVLPPIYVSNSFVGARLSFRQILALLLSTTAITSTILASMATVSCFFALTSRSYDFIKLLHVLFFAYAGLMGVGFLERTTDALGTAGSEKRTSHKLRIVWLLLYMFVGIQLAWVMRPYVGAPGEPFQVFRPHSGSFYESVLDSAVRLIKKDSNH